MADRPEKGDRVRVVMASRAFPWQRGPAWEATLVHRPQGPGDTFGFRVEQPQGQFATDIGEHVGRHVDLNTNSRDFVAFYGIDEAARARSEADGEQETG